jgi:hypothetical protein
MARFIVEHEGISFYPQGPIFKAGPGTETPSSIDTQSKFSRNSTGPSTPGSLPISIDGPDSISTQDFAATLQQRLEEVQTRSTDQSNIPALNKFLCDPAIDPSRLSRKTTDLNISNGPSTPRALLPHFNENNSDLDMYFDDLPTTDHTRKSTSPPPNFNEEEFLDLRNCHEGALLPICSEPETGVYKRLLERISDSRKEPRAWERYREAIEADYNRYYASVAFKDSHEKMNQTA